MTKLKKKAPENKVKKNNSEIVGSIYSTKDYSAFKFLNGNRGVNAMAQTRLIKSFDKKFVHMPIMVNENMEIIDGQSRFMILKEKELPVHYIVKRSYDIKETILLNSSGSKWTKRNYLALYCSQDSPEYVYLSNLMEEYAVGINTLLRVFAFYQKKTIVQIIEEFESGNFVVDEHDRTESFLTTLNMFKDARFIHYLDSCFVSALLDVSNKKDYTNTVMKNTFRKKAYSKQMSKKDYVRDLINIYNSCSKVKLKHDLK